MPSGIFRLLSDHKFSDRQFPFFKKGFEPADCSFDNSVLALETTSASRTSRRREYYGSHQSQHRIDIVLSYKLKNRTLLFHTGNLAIGASQKRVAERFKTGMQIEFDILTVSDKDGGFSRFQNLCYDHAIIRKFELIAQQQLPHSGVEIP